MKTVFQGEWNSASNGSVLTGVNNNTTNHNNMININGGAPLTPPDDYPTPPSSLSSSFSSVSNYDLLNRMPVNVDGWMEFWDYAGRTSFRAFVADDAKEKSLFAFFDSGLLNDRRDLKQAYAVSLLIFC